MDGYDTMALSVRRKALSGNYLVNERTAMLNLSRAMGTAAQSDEFQLPLEWAAVASVFPPMRRISRSYGNAEMYNVIFKPSGPIQ